MRRKRTLVMRKMKMMKMRKRIRRMKKMKEMKRKKMVIFRGCRNFRRFIKLSIFASGVQRFGAQCH